MVMEDKYFCLISGVLEVILLCQGIDVFPQIEIKFKSEGYFRPDIVSDNLTNILITSKNVSNSTVQLDTSTQYQDKKFSQIYSVCLILSRVLKLILGFVLDIYGIWFCKFIIITLNLIGNVLMMIVTIFKVDWLLFLAVPLQIAPTVCLIFLSVKLSDLDPENRGKWNTINTAMMAISSQIYLLYNYMPFEKSHFFWLMFLFFQPFAVIRTLFFTPKTIDFKNGIGWKTRKDNTSQHQKTIRLSRLSSRKNENSLKFICQPHLILVIIWALTSDLKVNLYTNNLESWLNWASDNNSQVVSNFTNVYTLFKILNFPAYLLVGFLIDFISHRLCDVRWKIVEDIDTNTVTNWYLRDTFENLKVLFLRVLFSTENWIIPS